jgi:hypothetical protein
MSDNIDVELVWRCLLPSLQAHQLVLDFQAQVTTKRDGMMAAFASDLTELRVVMDASVEHEQLFCILYEVVNGLPESLKTFSLEVRISFAYIFEMFAALDHYLPSLIQTYLTFRGVSDVPVGDAFISEAVIHWECLQDRLPGRVGVY